MAGSEQATSRRLRIVSDTLAGGLGAALRAQAAWFAQQGWDVAVMAPADGAGPAPPARWIELPAVASARDVRQVRAAVRALRSSARHEITPGTVVHVHGLRSLLLARLARVSTPFVTVHGSGPDAADPAGYGLLRRAWLGFVPRLAEVAYTVEPGYGPGWTYQPHASPILSSLDELPFPEAGGTPTFGWLGLLDHRKQPEVFVRALAAVAASGRPVLGLLGGTGPRAEEISELVAELDAPVEVLGQTDPQALLRRCWALALFARSEGTPLAVMEAMWAGRSVIGSRVPGIELLLGSTGALADDVDEAARAIDALAADHALAARRGREAALRVRALVQPDDPWPATSAAYEAHLARRA